MRKPLWVLLIILLAISAAAIAQYDEEAPAKISLRGGGYQPSGEVIKDRVAIWPGFAADYVFTFDEAGKPVDGISLIYIAVNKNLLDGRLTGVEYTRYWSESAEPDKGFYYGIGGGAYLTKAKITESFSTPALDESGTQFGFTALAGYHLSRYWFAEGRYTKLPELAPGVDLSGISFFVGIKRFLE